MSALMRRATADDVPAIVALLADDPMGATRETATDLTPYVEAFRRVDADRSEHLVVAELDGRVVATMQISYLPTLSRRGAIRAQLEGVRVAREARGHGVGEALVSWAIAQATAYGCSVVQLTSDNARPEAHRFYERLGFVASHTGYKLQL